MTVLILEDDAIISRDLMEILSSLVETIHIANSYKEACDILSSNTVDLCLCDINLNEEKSGIDFAKEAHEQQPSVQLIYITAHTDENTIKKMVSTSPLNYVVKPYTPQQILASAQLALVNIKNNSSINIELNTLTSKERQILSLIAKNKQNKEIADELFVSEKTVRNHRYNMLKKLDLPQEKNALLIYAIKMSAGQK